MRRWRELIFERYRIVYAFEDGTVYILTVLHAAMDMASHMPSAEDDA